MAKQKAADRVSAKDQAWRDRANKATVEMVEIDLKLKKIELERAQLALRLDEARLKNFLKASRG